MSAEAPERRQGRTLERILTTWWLPIEIDEVDGKPHAEGVHGLAGHDPQGFAAGDTFAAEETLAAAGAVAGELGTIGELGCRG